MVTDDLTTTELEILLAEWFTLPCINCAGMGGWGEYLPGGDSQGNDPTSPETCPDCGGTGVRHPLQKPCPGKEDGNYAWYTTGRCSICGTTDSVEHGWVWNDAVDALTEAIRAKGWSYQINGYADEEETGDIVVIYTFDSNETLGRVGHQEGLRGHRAMLVAGLRTPEMQGGTNGP